MLAPGTAFAPLQEPGNGVPMCLKGGEHLLALAFPCGAVQSSLPAVRPAGFLNPLLSVPVPEPHLDPSTLGLLGHRRTVIQSPLEQRV